MATNQPVESKVKAATTSTFLISLILAVLNDLHGDAELLAPLPGWLQLIVLAVVPAAITGLTGWKARHTPRGPAGV